MTLHCKGFTFSSPKVFLRKLLCSDVGGFSFRAKNSSSSNILFLYFWTFRNLLCADVVSWGLHLRRRPWSQCPCWPRPQMDPHSFLLAMSKGWERFSLELTTWDGIGELLWQDQNQTNTRKVDIMIHLVQLCCWFQTTDVTPSIMRVITIIIASNSFRLLNNEWPQLLGWGTCSAVAYIIDPGEGEKGVDQYAPRTLTCVFCILRIFRILSIFRIWPILRSLPIYYVYIIYPGGEGVDMHQEHWRVYSLHIFRIFRILRVLHTLPILRILPVLRILHLYIIEPGREKGVQPICIKNTDDEPTRILTSQLTLTRESYNKKISQMLEKSVEWSKNLSNVGNWMFSFLLSHQT